ncbi:MAG: thermonuclease family protein [Novosphingobium sp.]|jgi:endonuclease YncB( thermonuclease family)
MTQAIRNLVMIVGSLAAGLVSVAVYASLNAPPSRDVMPSGWVATMPVDGVLDGDTVVSKGVALHLQGIDAPELGPWAKCWAEAALAGQSKSELETRLSARERGWRLGPVSRHRDGRNMVAIVDKDGFALAEELVVSGHAAATDDTWDWCGRGAGLKSVEDGTPPPHGPSLWWPSGPVFDRRAND